MTVVAPAECTAAGAINSDRVQLTIQGKNRIALSLIGDTIEKKEC